VAGFFGSGVSEVYGFSQDGIPYFLTVHGDITWRVYTDFDFVTLEVNDCHNNRITDQD
jgi:hypothetical protein